MTRTATPYDPPTGHTDETCPVCDSVSVRVDELSWFLLDLERGDELRGVRPEEVDAAGAIEFACADCGSRWP